MTDRSQIKPGLWWARMKVEIEGGKLVPGVWEPIVIYWVGSPPPTRAKWLRADRLGSKGHILDEFYDFGDPIERPEDDYET